MSLLFRIKSVLSLHFFLSHDSVLNLSRLMLLRGRLPIKDAREFIELLGVNDARRQLLLLLHRFRVEELALNLMAIRIHKSSV